MAVLDEAYEHSPSIDELANQAITEVVEAERPTFRKKLRFWPLIRRILIVLVVILLFVETSILIQVVPRLETTLLGNYEAHAPASHQSP